MNNHQRGTMPTPTRSFERPGTDHDVLAGSQPREIRLMVVDDHPAVRVGLVQLLAGQLDFDVELVCPDAEGAVAQAELVSVDVAIVTTTSGAETAFGFADGSSSWPSRLA
jgi:hypothetical protein